MQAIIDIISNATLLNNLALIAFFVIFSIMFFVAHRDPSNPLIWTDMLVDTKTRKLSVSKLGNFFGIALSSWVVMYLVQVKEAYSIFPTIFIGWLCFLGGVYTLNNFIRGKTPGGDGTSDAHNRRNSDPTDKE